MATAKQAFEPKATLSNPIVEIATLDGALVRIEQGDVYETADPVVANDLANVDALKSAEPVKGGKRGGDTG